jgi:transcriptional regulator with XRE-family HTH domain
MAETKFRDVVRAYREKQGMTVRQFAEALSEKMVNSDLSFGTISRWESPKDYAADVRFFLECFVTYTDWRMYFAVDCLKAMMPHVFDTGMVNFHLPTAEKALG